MIDAMLSSISGAAAGALYISNPLAGALVGASMCLTTQIATKIFQDSYICLLAGLAGGYIAGVYLLSHLNIVHLSSSSAMLLTGSCLLTNLAIGLPIAAIIGVAALAFGKSIVRGHQT